MARNERSAGFVIFCRAGGPSDPLRADAVEYLLLDYGRHWDFPKGHVDKGEDDLAAAVRELREETGLTDARQEPGYQNEISYFFRDRKQGVVRKTVVFFLAETRTRAVILSHEHVGFEFLPYAAALKRLTFAGAKQILRSAHEHVTPGTEAAPGKGSATDRAPASDAAGVTQTHPSRRASERASEHRKAATQRHDGMSGLFPPPPDAAEDGTPDPHRP